VTDTELLEVSEVSENVVVPNTDIIGQSRNMEVALQHKAWMKSRENSCLQFPVHLTLHPELERIFGPGATRFALEYEGWDGGQTLEESAGGAQAVEEGEGVEVRECQGDSSSPKGKRSRMARRGKTEGGLSPSLVTEQSVDGSDSEDMETENLELGSSFITSGSEGDEESETKKLKLDDSDLESGLSEIDVVNIEKVAEIDSVTEVTRNEDNSESSGDAGFLPSEKSSSGEDDYE
jgi:hypothetical protein